MKKFFLFFCLLFLGVCETTLYAAVQRPVPRFVTLRSGEIKMRVGPGLEYPVKWILKRKDLPVKVTAEYDTWRQIQCHDGTEGWVHQGLLSGKRTLMAIGKECHLLASADADAAPKALIAPLTLMYFSLKECKGDRCYVKVEGAKGWVRKSQVWGLLSTE